VQPIEALARLSGVTAQAATDVGFDAVYAAH
jgi:hypothetical protein